MEKMTDSKKIIKDISQQSFREKDLSFIRLITLAVELGTLMTASILICFFLFRWFLVKINLSMNFQAIGIILGIFCGGYSCYRLLAKQLK